MAKIISFGGKSGSEKNTGKGNPFKSVWTSFQSLDKFVKFFILTALLIIAATPFITANLLETRQRAEGPIAPPAQMQLDKGEVVKKQTLELLSLTKQLKTNPDTNTQTKINSLVRERKANLLTLISENPGAALGIALTKNIKDSLPEEVRSDIENTDTIEGTLEVLIADDFDKQVAKLHYFLKTSDGKRINLYFTNGPIEEIYTDDHIQVKGIKLDDNMAVDFKNDFKIKTAKSAVKGITTPISKKIAVFLFNFQNDLRQPWTVDSIKNITFSTSGVSVRNYYKEVSFNSWQLEGKENLEGDVFGWYTIPYDNIDCNSWYNTWADAAYTAAVNDGHDMTGYNKFIYAFPQTSSCSAGGWAVIGGKASFVNGGYDLYTVSHELGHSFGLNHASSLTCFDTNGNRIAVSESCTSAEYGDPFDIMGANNTKHLNNFNKGRLGFFEPTNTLDVTADGTYTLEPLGPNTSGVQAIRIPHTKNSGGMVTWYYYLELRKPYGIFDSFPANSFVANGITIRKAPAYHIANYTYLYDTTPAAGNFYDSALSVGKTFFDGTRGISITTESVSDSQATVRVNFTPPTCTRAQPLLSILPLSQWGYPGETLSYSFTLSNRDSSACPSTDFTVSPTLPAGWSQNPTSFTVSLAPATGRTISFTVTSSSSAVEGFYSISQTAISPTNPSFTTSANYNVSLSTGPTPSPTSIPVTTPTSAPPTATPTPTPVPGDTTAPTVSITAPVNGAIVARNFTITLQAGATDNVAISKVDFLVNGSLICSDTTSPYSCNWKTSGKPNANYTISAKAYDTSGNTAINAVNVKSSK